MSTNTPKTVLSDEQIEAMFQQCGGNWNGDCWIIEDADLHPFARSIESAVLASSEGKGAIPREALYSALPPSAMDWLTSSEPFGAASQEWQDGWDACRNRVRMEVDAALSASSAPAPLYQDDDGSVG